MNPTPRCVLPPFLTLTATLMLLACGADEKTCGVAGATQICACPGGSTAGQSCQADGTWGPCGCQVADPLCDGVDCGAGGQCLIADGAPLCDCAPGRFGSGCGGVCEAGPKFPIACTTSFTPGQWYSTSALPTTPGTCLRATRLEIAAPQARVVNVAVGKRSDLSPPPGWIDSLVRLSDEDGDGVWSLPILLPAGEDWVYLFEVDGKTETSALAPTVTDETGTANLFEAAPCDELPTGAPRCERLWTDVGLEIACETPGQPGCSAPKATCPNGCIEDVWFGVAFPTLRTASEVYFRSDWHLKRPARWELWASSDGALGPSNGAALFAEGDARAAPWECVSGEPCDDPAVPSECCPDGRGQAQRVTPGEHVPKFEFHPVPEVGGAYFYLRIPSTQQPERLILSSLGVMSHDCVGTGGVFGPPLCREGGIGKEAGCEDGQWCAPGAGRDAASPGCVSGGDTPYFGACRTTADCAEGHICDGLCKLACDPAEPDTSCGNSRRCEVATRGDATLPFGVCELRECGDPLGSGECGPGLWCHPFTAWSAPICWEAGTGAPGEPCEAGCVAGATCIDSVCQQLCDAGIGWENAGPCRSGTTCLQFGDSGIGLCETPCDFDGAPVCGAGSFCDPAEWSPFGADHCAPIPSHWPDANGLPPGSPCDGRRCGPLTGCYGLDPDQDGTIDDTRCFAQCRLSLSGSPHPDCSEAVPNCLDIGDQGLGVCAP